MPLTTTIGDLLGALDAFLARAEQRLLCLRVDAELETALVKLLAGRAAAPGSDHLFFGASAPFAEPAAFFEEIRRVVLANLDDAEESLSRAEITPPDAELPASLRARAPEIALAEIMDRLARWTAVHARGVVLVLHPDAVVDAEALRTSIRRLVEASSSPRVKYIVLDRRVAPALDDLELDARRLVVAPSPRDAPAAELGYRLVDPAVRVIVLSASPARGRAVADAVLAVRGRGHVEVRTFSVRTTFADIFQFYEALGNAAGALLPSPGGVALLDTGTQKLGLEARFADRMERAAAHISSGHDVLVVQIEVAIAGDPAAFARSIERLATFAAASRLKYVIVTDTGGIPLRAPLCAVVHHTFAISPRSLEEGIVAAGSRPGATTLERLRHAMMLAGFAAARGDHERALTAAGESLRLAGELADPAEETLARLCLGDVLHRMGERARARAVYADVAASAQEQEHHILAAQAIASLGDTYFCDGDHPQAARCYAAAATYYEGLGNDFSHGHVLTWLGESRREMRDYTAAYEALQAASRCYEGAAATFGPAAEEGRRDALLRLSSLCRQMGRDGEARELADRASPSAGGAPLRPEP